MGLKALLQQTYEACFFLTTCFLCVFLLGLMLTFPTHFWAMLLKASGISETGSRPTDLGKG